MKQRHKIGSESKQGAMAQPPVAHLRDARPSRALVLPFTFTLLLIAFGWLPSARENSTLLWSFWGASAGLLVWNATLLATALRRGRTFTLEVVLRKQHYMQACAQMAVYMYWGWHWSEVYDSAALIVSQLVFAYAFDALLTWSRRNTYTFGFGPFPIIFAINLFLWFKADWFYLQFLMVAVGFAAKELLRWNKEGRQTHIFNPSSFPLGLFSMILILTGTTHLTWGVEIATTLLNPPHIYLLIFLVALPAQFLFGVTTMTLSAVVTTYAVGLLLFAVGVPESLILIESGIPIAVFIGMHMLFNDPSTSPRTELGRLIFGMLYGLSAVVLFALLGLADAPTFYDKLLAVPILNLMIQVIDRVARSNAFKSFDPTAFGKSLTPRRRNLAYMSVWATIFVVIQFLTGTQVALLRADTLLSQGQIDQAIAHYQELVRNKPDNVGGHHNLGGALIQAGRPQDALAPLRRALELQPDNSEVHNNLGVALIQTGQPQDALPPLRRALELQPDNPDAQNNLGWALIQTGQPQDALPPLRRALELQLDNPDAHNNFGVALIQTGRPQDALPPLRRALELQPDNPDVHHNLGLALIQAGRPQDALAPLGHALELQPDYPDALNNLGVALIQTGRPQDALAPLGRALELQPDNPEAHNNLGWALIQAGRPQDALAPLGRALELQSDYPDALNNLGVALIEAGRPQDAISPLRRALELQPENPDAHYNLGVMYQNGLGTQPDAVEAAQWYRQAADQGLADAQFNLGEMYASGEGVQRDYTVAHMWVALAVAQASGEVAVTYRRALSGIEARMTSEQIAEAQRLAREWKPQTKP